MKELLLNIDRATLFRRSGSRCWYARIVLAGTLHRRSTYCRNKREAREIMERWRLQLLRRGKPTAGPQCVADR